MAARRTAKAKTASKKTRSKKGATRKKAARSAGSAAGASTRSAGDASWSVNNVACRATAFALHVLAQHDKDFPEAGSLRMDRLTFWVPGMSSTMGQTLAGALAAQLDNAFRGYEGATYEPGTDQRSAVSAMRAILSDAGRSVAELAQVVDAAYRFIEEEGSLG